MNGSLEAVVREGLGKVHWPLLALLTLWYSWPQAEGVSTEVPITVVVQVGKLRCL